MCGGGHSLGSQTLSKSARYVPHCGGHTVGMKYDCKVCSALRIEAPHTDVTEGLEKNALHRWLHPGLGAGRLPRGILVCFVSPACGRPDAGPVTSRRRSCPPAVLPPCLFLRCRLHTLNGIPTSAGDREYTIGIQAGVWGWSWEYGCMDRDGGRAEAGYGSGT